MLSAAEAARATKIAKTTTATMYNQPATLRLRALAFRCIFLVLIFPRARNFVPQGPNEDKREAVTKIGARLSRRYEFSGVDRRGFQEIFASRKNAVMASRSPRGLS